MGGSCSIFVVFNLFFPFLVSKDKWDRLESEDTDLVDLAGESEESSVEDDCLELFTVTFLWVEVSSEDVDVSQRSTCPP